jgi:hypothetical protein
VSRSEYTDANVLAKIKNVDGAGSGLDADTVRGYVPVNKSGDTMTGDLTFGDDNEGIIFFNGAGGKIYKKLGSGLKIQAHIDSIGVAITDAAGNDKFVVKTDGTGITYNGNAVEIGRVDGVASTPYIDFHSGATVVDYDTRIIASGGTGVAGGGTLDIKAANVMINANKVWHSGNDGAGSGLDADMIDTYHAVDITNGITSGKTTDIVYFQIMGV